MLASCFALWGLLNTMTDTLVPAFGKIFLLNPKDSVWVQNAFYGSYAILAIPAALLIKKFSYRSGILVGLGFYILGALCFIPAAMTQNFPFFLAAIFVFAAGLSFLETTCNPFVLSMGPESTGIQRLNFAQAFNPVGLMVGIFLGKFVILSQLDPATIEERKAMTTDALAAIRNAELYWLCAPYILLIIIAVIIWVYFLKSKSSLKDEGEELNVADNFKSLLTNCNYVFGVVAQFAYVGVQTSIWTWTILYVQSLRGVSEAEAATTGIYAIALFIVMRWVCTGLMRIFTPAKLMTLFTLLAIGLTFGAIYLPTGAAILCLVGISGCMSLMFPTIYGIALKGLPASEVKLGAAGLIMAIGGGAVIPKIMAHSLESGNLNFLTPMFENEVANARSSFFIPVACFVIILAYACFALRRKSA